MQEMLKVNSHYGGLPKGLPPIGKTFNEYTPAELKLISDAEYWDGYHFKVGDRHAIELKGIIDNINLTGTWYAMIIGINHNAEKEGKGLTLQFANNSLTGGKNLAFYGFKMNSSDNTGGWEKSNMRTKTCTEFFNILPEEWQSIIKTVTKYTDNQGGKTDDSPMTVTKDKIFLPSEFEVYGQKTDADTLEKDYQNQYAYYKAGNSKIKFRHDTTNYAHTWWLRSPSNAGQFCAIDRSGQPYGAGSANNTNGFAPCFVI